MSTQLVIFDMDGTLTEDLLDFPAIRRAIGLPDNVPILEAIAQLPPDQRARAHHILNAHEMAAAADSKLHDGVHDVLAHLRAARIPTALLTRNSAACAATVLARHRLTFDAVATRDQLPHKPHPDSILNLVRQFHVTPAATLMVGDYLYDLQTATAAGVPSALLCLRNAGELPPYAAQATHIIRSLRDVLALI